MEIDANSTALYVWVMGTWTLSAIYPSFQQPDFTSSVRGLGAVAC